MKLVSNAEPLFRGIAEAFDAAVLDVRDEARAIAGRHSRTGKFAASIVESETEPTTTGFEARVGSTLQSAKAKEKGAYIAAKRGKHLVFDAGQGVRKVAAVRLPPRPAVTPAGRRFGTFMSKRLREELG